MSETDGGNLFIVDNSVSGWTGLEYLRQWSDLAKSFDIATGFFEIGALLALDRDWQKLENTGVQRQAAAAKAARNRRST